MIKRPLSFVCLIFLIIQGILLILRGGLSNVEVPASSIFVQPEGQEVVVTGVVYNKRITSNTQIIFLTNNSISNQEKIMIYDSDFTNISIGQTIQIKGTISHFDRARNPGNFDQFLYYAKDEIYGVIFCEKILQISGNPSFVKENLYQLKSIWKDRLIACMGEEQGNVLAAMILGEKSDMEDDIKEAYQKSGIGHVLAISGLHISFIGLGIYQLLRRLKVPFEIAGILSISVLYLYACMIGFSTSVFRAFVMLLLKIGADVSGRVYDLVTALMLSAALTIWRQPLYLTDAGFYLSYGAVLGLFIFMPYLQESFLGKKKYLAVFIPGICINIALLPIQLWYFYEFPIYSFLLNLIVIPLMSAVLTMGLIGSGIGFVFPVGGYISLYICKIILIFYEEISKITLQLPFSRLVIGKPELYELIFYYVIILLILSKIIKRKTIIAASYMCGLLLLLHSPIHGVQITMLDVGQGDGMFLRGPEGGTYFIDGGSSDVKEVGKYRIEPYLKYEGVSALDYAFISHGDGDHYSGIMEMLSRQSVGVAIEKLVLPENYKQDANLIRLAKTAKENGTKVMVMQTGTTLKEEDLKITCLQPNEESNLSGNQGSMVLEISYGKFDMLCTGDVEEEGERQLIEKVRGKEYEVLKVAHHGSKYSTEEEFLDAISVRIALISAGENNSYGHPHVETMKRLKTEKCKIYQTSENGAIQIHTDGNSLTFF